MKKICYVSTVPMTIKAFVLPVINYLDKYTDWDISVLCSNDDEFRKLLPENVHYIPVEMKRGISLGGIIAMLKMIRIFRQEKFDLIQYSTPNASLYASLAGAIARVPVRLYCQWGIAYVGFSGVKRRIFKTVEKIVCVLSTWIEPDSYGNLYFSHSEELYSADKSSVIWNGSASGVNLIKFDVANKTLWRNEIRQKLSIPDDAFVFGFIGRINGDKGINELFEAWQRISSVRNDAYLILVGNPEKADTVNQELHSWAENQHNVIFCGYTDVVEKYVSAMDTYILPSYREGFGSAVVEAEAMGVPVIVTDIPGPTDAMLPDETGLVVQKADVDSLYGAMCRMMDDSEMRERFSQAAYHFATERFDQEKLIEFIVEDRRRLLSDFK